MEEAQDKIAEALAKAAQSKGGSSAPGNSLLVDLAEKSKKIGEKIIDEHTAIKADQQEARRGTREEVAMLREVWSGTTIQIGEYKTLIRSSVQKPRIAKLIKDKVQILPLGEGNMPQS